jgi:hypothetical protein
MGLLDFHTMCKNIIYCSIKTLQAFDLQLMLQLCQIIKRKAVQVSIYMYICTQKILVSLMLKNSAKMQEISHQHVHF